MLLRHMSLRCFVLVATAFTGSATIARADTSNLENCLEKLFEESGSPGDNSNDTCLLVNTPAQNPNLFSFDYSVPNSPALELAGLSTDNVTPANSLKPFVLSLPGLLGSGGTSTSTALDLAPAWALGNPDSIIAEYEKPDAWPKRLWYRTRIGVALSKGDTGGSDPTQAVPSRVAIGLSVSLSDGSDPVMARTADDYEPRDPNDKNGPRINDSHWLHCLTANFAKWAPDERDDIRDINAAIQYIIRIKAGVIARKKLQDMKLGKYQGNPLDGRGGLARIVAIANQYGVSGASDIPPANDPEWNSAGSDILDALRTLQSGFNNKATEIANDDAWKAHQQASQDAIVACQKEASDVAQHGADLQIGAGVVLNGTPGTLSNLSDPNGAVWIAGRLPFTDILGGSGLCDPTTDGATRSEPACWTIGGSGRYSAGEMVATGDTTTPMFKANVAEGWIGIERIDTTMKLGGYFGYMDQSAVNDADKAFSTSGTRWLFSGGYSLSKWVNGLWVVGSYGNANGSATTLNDKVALLSLTFGPPDLSSTFKSSQSQAPAQ